MRHFSKRENDYTESATACCNDCGEIEVIVIYFYVKFMCNYGQIYMFFPYDF